MATTLARRLAAARDGDPMEFDQVKVRFAIETINIVYFLIAFFWDGTLTDRELAGIVWMVGALGVAVADSVWMLLRPGINHLRRRAAVVLDMAGLSVGLALGGEALAPIIAFYH